jgi:hypothetical protein
MAIPYVNVNILDGQLGVVLPLPEGESAKVGVSSAGTANTIYSANKPQAVKDQLGVGPLVQSGAYHVDVSRRTTYFVPLTSSIAGTNGTVTQVGGGPALTVTGAPRDDYSFVIKITKGGAAGTATFIYTQDGGDTWSGDITVPTGAPGLYVLGDTNVTGNFIAGTYELNATYSWTSVAPSFSLTNLADGITALLADSSKQWEFVHVVGGSTTVAASASLAAAMDTHMTTAQGQYRFAHAITEVASDTDSATITAFASFTSKRVSPCAGFCELDGIGGKVYKRNAAWPYAARLSSIEISEDAAWVGRGRLPGVRSLYRDEDKTPGLDAAGFVTLRTWVGATGFFITNPRIMAPLGSDFWLAQYRRVMDRACAQLRNTMLKYSSAKVKVNPATGFIAPHVADGIDNDATNALKTVLVQPDHAASATGLVKRDQNLLSAPLFDVEARVVPHSYPKGINITIGFKNPALAA